MFADEDGIWAASCAAILAAAAAAAAAALPEDEEEEGNAGEAEASALAESHLLDMATVSVSVVTEAV